MKSVAEFKRKLTASIGQDVVASNHKFDNLNGVRKIEEVKTQRIGLMLPVGHPRYDSGPSWVEIPKKDMIRFNADNSVTIMGLMWNKEMGEHVAELLTLTFQD